MLAARGGSKLVLYKTTVSELMRKQSPVGCGKDAGDHLLHVLEDPICRRVGLEIGPVVTVDNTRVRKLAHVEGRIDEKHVVVLEEKITGRGGLHEQFSTRHADKLNCDPDGRL